MTSAHPSLRPRNSGPAPPPYQAEFDYETGDVRAIKLIVSITLGITLVLAAGYLAAVVLSDGAHSSSSE